MNRRAFAVAAVLFCLLASPLLARPADAADVPVTLIASNFAWHVGSQMGAPKPTVDATAGDVLRLRVENYDNSDHTFTLPHFSVNRTLAPAVSPTNPTVIFVNVTTASGDVGTWQFY